MPESDQDDREYHISQILDNSPNFDYSYHSFLLSVLNKIPLDALKKLCSRAVVLFAINANHLGEVLKAPKSGEGPLLYLSPLFLQQSEQHIPAIIAHELAHVFLEHDLTDDTSTSIEYEADKLAGIWGFELPKSFTERL